MRSATRALFLSPFDPWCRENGSSVVIADLLEAVADVQDVELLPVFLRVPPAGLSSPGSRTVSGVTLGIEPLPKWFSVPLAVGTGRSPWWEVRFADRAVARRIARLAKSREFVPSVIHVEHLVLVPIGVHLARVFGCPLVYRAHNIESQLWGRRIGGGMLKDGFIRHLERREARSMEACDLTLCISEVDLDWARTRAPRSNAEVQPVGLRLSRFRSRGGTADVVRNRIGFVGGLDWPPNEIGLRWFVTNVLPRMREELPDVTLAVLARGADTRPWLVEHPGVQVLAQDVDAATVFASSRVSIAPLLEGGGVRVKILESLAAGCPVVATSIGGEGLALSGLTHTDDPAEFTSACLRHTRGAVSTDSRDDIRAAVASKHGADVVARQLVDRWAAVRSAAPDSRVAG
jgi:glycosyltransferase involved in cell wall biosynthesis